MTSGYILFEEFAIFCADEAKHLDLEREQEFSW